MTDGTDCAVTAYVSGRVQGVCFRAFSREQALAAGLCGWANNLPDGRVEVRLQGSRQAVDTVLAALHQGPPGALVSQVHCVDTPPQPLQGFSIA